MATDQRHPGLRRLSVSFILCLRLLPCRLFGLAASDLRRTLTCSLGPHALKAAPSLPLILSTSITLFWRIYTIFVRGDWICSMRWISHIYSRNDTSVCTCGIVISDRLHERLFSCWRLSVQGTSVVWHEQAGPESGVLMLRGLSLSSLVPEVCRETSHF